ncbi:hypothetical protein [Flaviflexus huanghaiensis]|nr:hypothetical protein [Flaviflexus huanghaiensis]
MKHAFYALLGRDIAAVRRELADVRTMPINDDVRQVVAALEQMERELEAD